VIVYFPWLAFFLRRTGYRAITLWPLVFIVERTLSREDRLMRHERIHLRQQLELGVLPFYIMYILEYLLGRLSGLTHDAAYRGIRFEREAFQNENDPDFLKNRKVWAVFRRGRAGRR